MPGKATNTGNPTKPRKETNQSARRQVRSGAQRKPPKHSQSVDLGEKTREVYRSLKGLHEDATIALNFSNPAELMVATILSAQCTDAKVNQVTPALFKRFKTPAAYAKADVSEIEELIRPTGFFRQKAKSIHGCMLRIVNEFGGEVPKDMETLSSMPGIGRKTANVILGNAFGIPGLPVDTHVRRVTNRIGLTSQQDPVKIESEMCSYLPPKDWTLFSHTMIFHGRRICQARTPLCEKCPVTDLCDFYRDVVLPGREDN